MYKTRFGLRRPYDAVFEMDCDFSHNPDDLLRLAAALEKGADVARKGSSFASYGKVQFFRRFTLPCPLIKLALRESWRASA